MKINKFKKIKKIFKKGEESHLSCLLGIKLVKANELRTS